jgi:environmental stress-induced protein Ves
MRTTLLRPRDYRDMPWKNGLGSTTEIARFPPEGDFDWRISVARVTADGPFSKFPDCDRVILALDGSGMRLTHEESGLHVTLGVLEAWAFSGDWTTSCALRGDAFRDFNVIVRRAAFSAEVEVLRVDEPLAVEFRASGLLYCVDGACDVEQRTLAAGETLLLERERDGASALALVPRVDGTIVVKVDLVPQT